MGGQKMSENVVSLFGLNFNDEFTRFLENTSIRNVTSEDEAVIEIVTLSRIYYFLTLFIVEKGLLEDSEDGELFLYAKINNDLLGIYQCASVGLYIQAHMLLRSLLETVINLKFIYKDIETRMPVYINYKDVEILQQTTKEKYPTLLTQQKKKELRKKTDKKYAWGVPWYYNISSTFKDLGSLANEVGMTEEYKKIYGSLSSAIHGNASLASFYKQGNEFYVMPIENSKISKDLYYTTLYLMDIGIGSIINTKNHPYKDDMLGYSKKLVVRSSSL
jgi:hypothetical protein